MKNSDNNTSKYYRLQLRLKIRSLFTRIRYPLGGLPALDDAHIVGLDKIDGFYITESDTLGITIANVAFEDSPIGGIKIHGPEWTNTDAGAAADTGIIVNGYTT